MAVDSRQKRFSMMNFVSGGAVHLHNLFEPDGVVEEDDRIHLLDLYSGLLLSIAINVRATVQLINQVQAEVVAFNQVRADVAGLNEVRAEPTVF